jgi:hypothetical protein
VLSWKSEYFFFFSVSFFFYQKDCDSSLHTGLLLFCCSIFILFWWISKLKFNGNSPNLKIKTKYGTNNSVSPEGPIYSSDITTYSYLGLLLLYLTYPMLSST